MTFNNIFYGVLSQARKGAADGVEVALNPEELDMDTVAMAAKYEARVREQEMVQKEDFSDMVAEHAAKQKVGVAMLRTICFAGMGVGLKTSDFVSRRRFLGKNFTDMPMG